MPSQSDALASELWCYSEQHFSAVHRSLWHLSRVRCSVAPSVHGSSDALDGVDVLLALTSTKSENARSSPSFVQVTPRTRVFFLAQRYHFVFSVDLSPSMFGVDTSFKGFSTGTYLVDSYAPSLEDVLRALLADMVIADENFQPEVFITVLAHGGPEIGYQILLQCVKLENDSLPDILSSLSERLSYICNNQTEWLSSRLQEDNGVDKNLEHNAFEKVIRNCLLVLSLSPVTDATSAIVVFTDGVLCSPFCINEYDGLLMHLNVIDCPLHIVQLGGGFAPWSALGMCSDLDLLQFLTSSTPGGVLFQDHHIAAMQGDTVLTGDTPVVNALQKAWLWRASHLCCQEDSHKAFSDCSFLSSLMDKQEHREDDEQSYITQLRRLGCQMPDHLLIDGLDMEVDASEPISPTGDSLSPPHAEEPQLHQKHGSSSSFTAGQQHDTSGYQGHCWEEDVLNLGGYAAPGGQVGQYAAQWEYPLTLPLALLVACRVREGFRVLEYGRQEKTHEVGIRFGLTWQPMFNILYTVIVIGHQDVKVRIQSRAPPNSSVRSRFGEHRHQSAAEFVESFVEKIRQVDVSLSRLVRSMANSEALRGLTSVFDVDKLHHLFSVQRFEFTAFGARALQGLYERLEAWASETVSKARCYVRVLKWRAAEDANDFPKEFWCRCCAPDGVPPTRPSNRAFLPEPGYDWEPAHSFYGATQPCCVVQVQQVQRLSQGSQQGQESVGAKSPKDVLEVASIVVGIQGLCPHAERALLQTLKTHILGADTYFPSPLSSLEGRNDAGANGNSREESCRSMLTLPGRPGILRSLLDTFSIGQKKVKLPRTMSMLYEGTHSQDLVKIRENWKASSVTCNAITDLGPISGSFYTFVPHWYRLKDCIPHWSHGWMFNNEAAVSSVYRIIVNQRLQEGWHCVRSARNSCVLIKWVSVKARTSKSARRSSIVESGGNCLKARTDTIVNDVVIQASGEKTVTGTVPEPAPASELPYLFKISWSDSEIIETIPRPNHELKDVDRMDASVLIGKVVAGSPVSPRVHSQQERALDAVDDTRTVSNLYLRIHVEATKNVRTVKEFHLSSSLWLDSILGSFDAELPQQQSWLMTGPWGSGTQIASGQVVRLTDWQACVVRKARATAVPVFPQWPSSIELRLLGVDDTPVLTLFCQGGSEACAEQDPVHVVTVELFSTGGPATLLGLCVEVMEENVKDNDHDIFRQESKSTITSSNVEMVDFGNRIAEELKVRDSLAESAVAFVEGIQTREDSNLNLRCEYLLADETKSAPTIPIDMRRKLSLGDETSRKILGMMRCLQAVSELRFTHARVTSTQHDRFLRRVSDLSSQSLHYEGCDEHTFTPGSDENSFAPRGHYFFTLHRDNRSSVNNLEFTMVFIPSIDDEAQGMQTVCVGDGNVECLQPPAASDAVVKAVLSSQQSGGTESNTSASRLREFGLSDENIGDLSQLRKQSKDLARQVEELHWYTCAGAICSRLQYGAPASDAELVGALKGCSRTTATLPIKPLIDAAARLEAKHVVSVGEWLDECVAESLLQRGFAYIKGGDDVTGISNDSGTERSWICYATADQSLAGAHGASEPVVCFLQIRMTLCSNAESWTPRAATDSDSVQRTGGNAPLFSKALCRGCTEEVRIVVHYLREPMRGGVGASARGSAAQHNRDQISVRWDNMRPLSERYPDIADRVLLFGDDLTTAIDLAHTDLLRLALPHKHSTLRTVQSLFSRMSDRLVPDGPQLPYLQKYLHSENMLLPIARPALYSKAHKMLLSHLETPMDPTPDEEPGKENAERQSLRLNGLAKVKDVPMFAWLDPIPSEADGVDSEASGDLQKVDPLALGQLQEGPVDVVEDAPIQRASCDSLSPSNLPSRRGSPMPTLELKEVFLYPAIGRPPPFWILIMIPEEVDSTEPAFTAQINILFSPTYIRASAFESPDLADAQEFRPFSPQPFVSRCRSALWHVIVHVNQKLLLDQAYNEGFLSELLHPELRDNSTPTDDLSPNDLLNKKDDGGAGHGTTAFPIGTNITAVAAVAPRRAAGRKNKAVFQDDEEPAAEKPLSMEDPRFLRLMPALDCALQGAVEVWLAPCLHRYHIISWLGGGEAEPAKKSTAKVTIQDHKMGKANEVASIFQKRLLKTCRSTTVWLLWVDAGSGDTAKPYFVRPSYERNSASGVILRLNFFGITPLSRDGRDTVQENLKTQLEKLAIQKLQLTFDRQKSLALKNDVWEFLAPPNTKPGKCLLLRIPRLNGKMIEYSLFVRCALMGLLETIDNNSTEVNFDSTMRFVYKRRQVEQHSIQRASQRRDKVSDKVLQFQSQVGDGVAYVMLFFINSNTGRVFDSPFDAPNAIAEAMALQTQTEHAKLATEIDESAHVIRTEDGRFGSLAPPLFEHPSSTSGFLLLDVWHRAMSQEQAEQLIQEMQTAIDQALREFHLQVFLRDAPTADRSSVEAETDYIRSGFDLERRLGEFQENCSAQLEHMPHQHLSSLLTQRPPDVQVGPVRRGEAMSPTWLPPWACLRCVEALYELLKAAEQVPNQCLVTLQGEKLLNSAPTLQNADGVSRERENCLWFDLEDSKRTFQLSQLCQDSETPGESDIALSLTTSSLYEKLVEVPTWSPRFTFMWGPAIRPWRRKLISTKHWSRILELILQEVRNGENGKSWKTAYRKGDDDDHHRNDRLRDEGDGSPEVPKSFAVEVAQGHHSIVKLSRLVDQQKVREGGAAGLTKDTLEAWRQADRFLSDENCGLSSPFLLVTVGAFGAQLRGVRVDPQLLSRVEYFLRSQFLWVWARMHLLKNICALELNQDIEDGAPDRRAVRKNLERELPWVFDKEKRAKRRMMVPDDSSSIAESADDTQSVANDDQSDTEPSDYDIFGLPKSVAEILLQQELVPAQPQSQPDVQRINTGGSSDPARASDVASEHSGTVKSSRGGTNSFPLGGHPLGGHRKGLTGRLEVQRDSTRLLMVPSTPEGSRFGSKETSMSRGSVAPIELLEASIIKGGRFDEQKGLWRDVCEVLRGVPLMTGVIEKADGGFGGGIILKDPLGLYAGEWLTEVEDLMGQHQLKLNVVSVLEEWERQNLPIATWAREALQNHESMTDAGERLVVMDKAIKDRMPHRRSDPADERQDPAEFQAEALLLSLVHDYSVTLAHPETFSLYIVPGIEAVLSRRPIGTQKPTQIDPITPDKLTWQFRSQFCSLSDSVKLQASPQLTMRQHFLSRLLTAFTQHPSPNADVAAAAAAGWALVLCAENPLPWHGWEVLGISRQQCMRPQSLVLYRAPGWGITSALLMEVSCRVGHDEEIIRVEVLGKGCEKTSDAGRDAKEILESVRSFCFDFQLRSLGDSPRPLSLTHVEPCVTAVLNDNAPLRAERPERARNLLVQGQLPCRKISEWLAHLFARVGQSDSQHMMVQQSRTSTESNIKAHTLVSAMHSLAGRYGFDRTGMAHEPLFAMTAQDHRFKRVLDDCTLAADFQPIQLHQDGLASSSPINQGLRCVLFAIPVCADGAAAVAARNSLSDSGASTQLGFRYAALLIDLAWCTPPCVATKRNRDQWAEIAEALRTSAEETLTAFVQLSAASLVAMRRFEAVSQNPKKSKLHHFEDLVAACKTKVNLLDDPFTGHFMRAMQNLPAASWSQLGKYLQDFFGDRCATRYSDDGGDSLDANEIGQTQHVFIITTLGAPQTLYNDEKHYVLLQLTWSLEINLECIWLHSSHRIPPLGSGTASSDFPCHAIAAPMARVSSRGSLTHSVPFPQDELSLLPSSSLHAPPTQAQQPAIYTDEWLSDDYGDEETQSLRASGGRCQSTSSVPTVALPSTACALDLLVRRFVGLLMRFSFPGSYIQNDTGAFIFV